jgi:predicted dehydrogenase
MCLTTRIRNLVALIDPSPTAPDIASKMAPSVPYFKSVLDMLSALGDSKPQAAIVCVPNSLHVPVAKEFVAAGIDLLVEKPLTDSIEDGRSLLEEVKKKGVKLLVGHHKRFNHYSMATKAVLESGVIGDLTAVSALWMGYKPDAYYEVPWRRSKSQGGGVVLNNFVQYVFCSKIGSQPRLS